MPITNQGDADGKGNIRKKELFQACVALKAMSHSNGTVQCLANEHSRRSFIAMAQHSSQWVCFPSLNPREELSRRSREESRRSFPSSVLQSR
ncbi:hypothetical protein Fmac_004985 [Flemingia macrophylla]|uniref:EF-hand domain-containing protein n=1 Tax=Flemingia macrophylla TaxID=520843 RepID=A0ABD1N936_9FABA